MLFEVHIFSSCFVNMVLLILTAADASLFQMRTALSLEKSVNHQISFLGWTLCSALCYVHDELWSIYFE